MSLLLVGVNHKTAPVEVREQLAFSDATIAEALPHLADGAIIREALLLSTCNRVEILVEGEADVALARVVNFLAETKSVAADEFEPFLYCFSDAEAVGHLFRVASSLDSMIIGETQILGQVRQAYKIASEVGTARRTLHKLLHHAFQTAKRVRSETGIAINAVSVSSAAVEMASKVFGSLENKTVLLIGAGEMAELAAKHLIQHGVGRILISNRTFDNAVSLAMEFGGEVVAFEKLDAALSTADIVICSTGATKPLVTTQMIATSQTVRSHSPTLLIDISVPRNIEPTANTIENVYLADVDDLQNVVTANLQERTREAVRAEAIIETEVEEFWQSLQTMSFGETLGLLRQKMQETARAEFTKQRGKLGDLTAEQVAAIEKMLISTANQIAHPILYGLRRSHEHGAAELAETLCDLLTQEVQSSKSKVE